MKGACKFPDNVWAHWLANSTRVWASIHVKLCQVMALGMSSLLFLSTAKAAVNNLGDGIPHEPAPHLWDQKEGSLKLFEGLLALSALFESW